MSSELTGLNPATERQRKACLYVGQINETGVLERARAEALVAARFDSFSCALLEGYWRGRREQTLKIEVVITEAPVAVVLLLAGELARALGQESVLVEVLEVGATFVGGQAKAA